MKRFLTLSLLLLISFSLSAQGSTLRMGVITDTHFLSPALMEDSKALNDYITSSGKNVKAVPEVLDNVLSYYADTAHIDVLLVAGDLTKDGERQSHLEFADKLKQLTQKGIKVFVVPGNHDVNMPNSNAYMKGGVTPVENISAEQFATIYVENGYGNALQRDDHSLSYVAELNADTWLLALDAARYEEYKDRSITHGRIKKGTEAWMLSVLDDAKKKNKSVIAMMHWGIIEHIMYQSQFFAQYLVDDWQHIASLLADNGVRVVFTGHFHATDITRFTSEAGNSICDVETGTLCSFPYAYRVIECRGDSMQIVTHNVSQTANYPNLRTDDIVRLEDMGKTMALRQLKNMGFDLPANVANSLAAVASRIFLLHLQGDEVMDDELREVITDMARSLDGNVDVENVKLDFDPADNNVTIQYR